MTSLPLSVSVSPSHCAFVSVCGGVEGGNVCERDGGEREIVVVNTRFGELSWSFSERLIGAFHDYLYSCCIVGVRRLYCLS